MARPHRLSSELSFRQSVEKYDNWLSHGLTTLAQIPDAVRTHIIAKKQDTREFWFDLLAQLDFYDAKILEHVYQSQAGATTLQLMVRQLRRVGVKREAIRRRVLMLKELGLLQVVMRTNPLCITAKVELEAKVLSLVRGVFKRLGVDRL